MTGETEKQRESQRERTVLTGETNTDRERERERERGGETEGKRERIINGIFSGCHLHVYVNWHQILPFTAIRYIVNQYSLMATFLLLFTNL